MQFFTLPLSPSSLSAVCSPLAWDITATEEEALAKKKVFFPSPLFFPPKQGKEEVWRDFLFFFFLFCVHLFLKRGGGRGSAVGLLGGQER